MTCADGSASQPCTLQLVLPSLPLASLLPLRYPSRAIAAAKLHSVSYYNSVIPS